MNNFESTILPNEQFSGKTIFPENRPTLEQWFKEHKVSTRVLNKPSAERHVFDTYIFKKNTTNKWGLIFTVLRDLILSSINK